MKVTITTLTDIILTLDVSPDMELDNFKALCECEAGIPSQEIVVMHEGLPLLDDKKDLKTYGIKEGDVLLLQQFLPQRLPLEGALSPLGIDFSTIRLPATGSQDSQGQWLCIRGKTSNTKTENDRYDTLRDAASLPTDDYLAKTENKWIGINPDRDIMDLAATKIQALYRGYKTRSRLAQNKHLVSPNHEEKSVNWSCSSCKKIYDTKLKFDVHHKITQVFINNVKKDISEILERCGSENYNDIILRFQGILNEVSRCLFRNKKPAVVATTMIYLCGKLIQKQHTLKDICAVKNTSPGEVFKLAEVIRKETNIGGMMPIPANYLDVWAQKLQANAEELNLAKYLARKILKCSNFDRHSPVSLAAVSLLFATRETTTLADISEVTGVAVSTLNTLKKIFGAYLESLML